MVTVCESLPINTVTHSKSLQTLISGTLQSLADTYGDQIFNHGEKIMNQVQDVGSFVVSSGSDFITKGTSLINNVLGTNLHFLAPYDIQMWKRILKSKHPKFINSKTMRDTYIKGPRGGQYYMNTKGHLFRM
jgi:hypothetical protein